MGIILFGDSKMENLSPWDKDGGENRPKKDLG
jgi:hypothetical protein